MSQTSKHMELSRRRSIHRNWGCGWIKHLLDLTTPQSTKSHNLHNLHKVLPRKITISLLKIHFENQNKIFFEALLQATIWLRRKWSSRICLPLIKADGSTLITLPITSVNLLAKVLPIISYWQPVMLIGLKSFTFFGSLTLGIKVQNEALHPIGIEEWE